MKRQSITSTTAVMFLALVTSSHAVGWALIDAKIRRDFPQVQRITTTELAGWLNDQQRSAPLLLDMRSRAEYEMSHLPNARHVEPDAPAEVIEAATDRPIVTYCSVGYRFGAFAERLRRVGFVRVANLKGSILRWANEGRRVEPMPARWLRCIRTTAHGDCS